jgi:hypothetical protein
MEQSNWDERLDTGTSDGKPDRKLGHCLVCGLKGTASETLRHHVDTRHAFSYRGIRQICPFRECLCDSKPTERTA